MHKAAKYPEDPASFHDAAARHSISKIARVPDAYRKFNVTAIEASRIHRIEPALLEQLLDLGLPHQGSGRERRFDQLDLGNIGIELRLPCPRWTAMRWWSRMLPVKVKFGSAVWALTLKTDCPTPTREHDCKIIYYPNSLAADGVMQEHQQTANHCRAELTTNWINHCFGELFDTLIEQILPVEFHLLPGQLSDDSCFVKQTGLANCYMATGFLVRTAIDLGLPVRPASGILLSRPMATYHSWVEFYDQGTWLAADPFILNTFIRWGLSDPKVWPVNRSPGGVLWPFAAASPVLASHNGVPVDSITMFAASGSLLLG